MSDGEQSKSGYEKDAASEEAKVEQEYLKEVAAEKVTEDTPAPEEDEDSGVQVSPDNGQEADSGEDFQPQSGVLAATAEPSTAVDSGEDEPESGLVVSDDAEQPAKTTETVEPDQNPPEETAPNEPDQSQEKQGPSDPDGIVTKLTPAAFDRLTEVWKSRGSPHQFDYQSARWSVYDNGEKFIRTGGQGSLDKFYGSLSIS